MLVTTNAERRTLRPRGEVRRLLLNAARTLFAQHGYAGTSTRAISKEAGVTHSLLHVHFPSKAGLFEEAVFDPLAGYIERFVSYAQQRATRTKSLEQECRFFVEGLYDVLHENKELILALIAADTHEKELKSYSSAEHETPFDQLLDRLEQVTEQQIEARGLRPSMPGSSIVRLTFGMVLSAAVLDQWIFRPPRRKKDVVDDVIAFMIKGITDKPPP